MSHEFAQGRPPRTEKLGFQDFASVKRFGKAMRDILGFGLKRSAIQTSGGEFGGEVSQSVLEHGIGGFFLFKLLFKMFLPGETLFANGDQILIYKMQFLRKGEDFRAKFEKNVGFRYRSGKGFRNRRRIARCRFQSLRRTKIRLRISR